MFIFEDVSTIQYAIAILGASSLGLSKAGFPGFSIINVFLVAELFGAKNSVGIILPLLIACDFAVYPLFRKYASWRQVVPLFPPVIAGVVVGWLLLGNINELTARRTLGAIVLIMVVLQLIRTYRLDFLASMPDSRLFHWGSGLGMGIATTLANAAGPVYGIYGLVRKMTKEEFLGISARLFLFVNLFKVPFNAQLEIITVETLKLDLVLLPGVLVGIFAGKHLVSKIPQKAFNHLIVAFTILAGIRLAVF